MSYAGRKKSTWRCCSWATEIGAGGRETRGALKAVLERRYRQEQRAQATPCFQRQTKARRLPNHGRLAPCL
jgi:hypothetical protein